MAPFYGWGSAASKLEPLPGGSLLFTITTKLRREPIETGKNTFFSNLNIRDVTDNKTFRERVKTSFLGKRFHTVKNNLNPLTTNVPHHIDTSQLICNINRLTGFCMIGNNGR